MNICSLFRIFYGVEQLTFNSSRTIFDFEAVFIDSVGFVPAAGEINPNAVHFRQNEFSEFLALGRTLVVFLAPCQLNMFLPIPPAGLKPISGSKTDFKGPEYLKSFWQSIQQDMQFFAYLDTAPGKPFLFISATSKSVATLIKKERGHILLLPRFKEYQYASENQEACARFIAAFKKLNEYLNPKKSAAELPAWSAHYGWEQERKLRENLILLEKQSDEIAKQISITKQKCEVEERLKILFTGKGDILVDTVISALNELGANAKPGEPGRDDVILVFDEKHAVIEVKGKKSSAAESDAAQLEKWVAGFKEENGNDPKGILLIDAYCETPLAERTEPAFPHQMLKYSTQREHCLITTTQLLGLLLEARNHPEKRVELVNDLFSTVGVYQEFTDWRKFLTAPAPASVEAK